MRFKCECGKLFMYPTKRTALSTGLNFENQICPFCGSLNFDEYTPPQPDIASLRKAGLDEVDTLIGEGYVVHSVFANHVILVKRMEEKKL